MAAPANITELPMNPGAHGDAVTGVASSVDADPYGGAINTAIAFSGSESGALINIMMVSSDEDLRYFGAAYRNSIASGSGRIANCKFYNRSGAQLNTTAGTAQLLSDNAADVGIIWIVGKVSGLWIVEPVTLSGLTPVTSSNTWDELSVYRWESFDALGVPTPPYGTVSCSVNGERCAVLRGTVAGNATLMASAEIQMALCTAFGTTIAGTDRLSFPAQTGSSSHTFIVDDYSRNTRWDGNDQAIPVPGGDFVNATNIGFSVFQDVPIDIPVPALTYVEVSITPTGNPKNS